MSLKENLAALAKVAHRKVKAVAAGDDAAAAALFEVAKGNKTHWDKPEWDAVLKELDCCGDKVEDWLALRT